MCEETLAQTWMAHHIIENKKDPPPQKKGNLFSWYGMLLFKLLMAKKHTPKEQIKGKGPFFFNGPSYKPGEILYLSIKISHWSQDTVNVLHMFYRKAS